MEHTLNINCSVASVYSLAFQQNHYPLISDFRLSIDPSGSALHDIVVTFSSDVDLFEPTVWNLDYLDAGQSTTLHNKAVQISYQKLEELSEQVVSHLRLEVRSRDQLISEEYFETLFMPKNFWAGEQKMPELLAAFSTPNASYVDELILSVSRLLEKSGLDNSLNGYQSNTREKPYLLASALWSVIQSKKITYVNPVPSFASSGQRIRLPDDIASSPLAACLDLSMLFTACLERMGLNSIVLLTETHAFVGMWLIDDCLPLICIDDPMDVRKRVASQDLVVFETTLVARGSQATFGQAIEHANLLLSEESEKNFVLGVDIRQARKRQITPLPSRLIVSGGAEADTEVEKPVIVSPPPPLPPVSVNEQPNAFETPETRVEQWKRKLLDLTKRNRLLNLANNAMAVRLFCPDIGLLEDKLAAGEVFSFLAAEKTPLSDTSRSREIFRFETGNSLQVQFATEQLANKTLIVNDTEKRLDNQLLSLFRKAKTDMEEGGSNTLYLAIGMLRWKEAVKLEKSYRAPLILLPVELMRASARSPIRIKQIKDEEPIFNSTLIQFLQQDFELNLSKFKNELPLDDSGIDVAGIWNFVRQVVKDVPGFEVVEELVLSNFSFAKYLMWKDLQDRVDHLKKNAFVEHLVDRPTEIYQQDSHFVELQDVDTLIKPSDIFAPMNADSSQIVAIEASGHPQDFIMEGPPGTGKSETIANIICHNLALGKKVLFVSEKMAALNVVYKRLEKVGINHLCLELHSSKANKVAVLEQLRNSWQGRAKAEQSDWLQKADELYAIRGKLNTYVQELHRKTKYGFSVRDTISRASRFNDIHRISLNWGVELSNSPVKTASEIEELFAKVKTLAIAFSDLEEIDTQALSLININAWSNAWQADLISKARDLIPILESYSVVTKRFIAALGLESDKPITVEHAMLLGELTINLQELQKRKLSLPFAGDVKDKIQNLEHIIVEKESIDKKLKSLNIDMELRVLVGQKTSVWKSRFQQIEHKVWPLSFFGRLSLRKEINIQTGCKILDLSIVRDLNDINLKSLEIAKFVSDFEVDKIWKGWETSTETMRSDLKQLTNVSGSIRGIISALDIEPSHGMAVLRKLFVDNWDFIDTNNDLINLNLKTSKASEQLLHAIDSFENAAGSTVDRSIDIGEFNSTLKTLIEQERKFNIWCNWLDAKKRVSEYSLEPFILALEDQTITSENLLDNIQTGVANWFAPKLIDASPTLRGFSASTHDALIHDFRAMDTYLAANTAAFIVAKTASIIPSPNDKNQPPEYGVLSRELVKKSKHKAVRQLVEEMGEALLNLTPCLMMSPLSVAQFLPANFNNFDLVVFDEASQITVWDAVGAIARGKNTIVVGDPKQMPPTNFFGRGSADDGDEEDLESILDQALAARIKHHRLTGHYRSKHESLIAFSNSHYYENSLVTFPSAETKQSAVSLHSVNGVYAKGKERNNPVEARAVATEVLRRLTDPDLQNLTIGVVALNSEQQRTIEDELDTVRRANPHVEKFFQGFDNYDPIFIKNLESVQGDERDVIMISVGYGPTEQGSKSMSMNFGPLNKQGGERRLNVAVTRATTELLLFASFDSSMIDLSRTQAKAVRHLKSFFEFAEFGPSALAAVASANHGVDQFDSDFEQAVAFRLRDLGWTVQTQVGVGKFRIDLGVVHPEHPGRFIAGVECDGATYHGSPAARDRDRVRQAILEGLGWNIIRLWSTDYFIDPDRAVDKIHKSILAALEADKKKLLSRSDTTSSSQTEIDDVPSARVDSASLDKTKFFESGYDEILVALTREILTEMDGIALFELVSVVSRRFGIARSTQSQVERIRALIKSWAGISNMPKANPTIWVNKNNIVPIIPWRGIAPFGIKRHWKEISYHERLGAVEAALKTKVTPVSIALKDIFQMDRLAKSTADEFDNWLKEYNKYLQK